MSAGTQVKILITTFLPECPSSVWCFWNCQKKEAWTIHTVECNQMSFSGTKFDVISSKLMISY